LAGSFIMQSMGKRPTYGLRSKSTLIVDRISAWLYITITIIRTLHYLLKWKSISYKIICTSRKPTWPEFSYIFTSLLMHDHIFTSSFIHLFTVHPTHHGQTSCLISSWGWLRFWNRTSEHKTPKNSTQNLALLSASFTKL